MVDLLSTARCGQAPAPRCRGTLSPRGSLPLLLRGPGRPAGALRQSVAGPGQLRLGLVHPVLPVLRRAADDPLEDLLPVLRGLRAAGAALGPDRQLVQTGEDGLPRLLGAQVELAAAHAHEAPAQPLEDGLPGHVLAELLDRFRLVAVALDRQPPPGAFHDQVDRVMADPPVRQDPLAGLEEAVVDLVLQRG